MTRLKMDGNYSWHGKENIFSGILTVDVKGHLEGEIEDPNSRCPLHKVEGRIFYKDEKVILDFIKSPTGGYANLLQPVAYQLVKSEVKQQDLVGSYNGAWRLLYPEHAHRLAVGYKSGIGECVVLVPEETGNLASVVLSD